MGLMLLGEEEGRRNGEQLVAWIYSRHVSDHGVSALPPQVTRVRKSPRPFGGKAIFILGVVLLSSSWKGREERSRPSCSIMFYLNGIEGLAYLPVLR